MLRFSYFFVSFAQHPPQMADCPTCLGMGAPSMTLGQDSPLEFQHHAVLGRRYHLNDVVSWQKGLHHIRFGGDWETSRGGRTNLSDEPVTMNLFSPQDVRDFNALQPPDLQIPLPATFLTVPDILQLPFRISPLASAILSCPRQDLERLVFAPLVHLFFQDTWRLRPRLVVDYGIGWTYDAPLNYDLPQAAVPGACSWRGRPASDPQELEEVLAVGGFRLEPEA